MFPWRNVGPRPGIRYSVELVITSFVITRVTCSCLPAVECGDVLLLLLLLLWLLSLEGYLEGLGPFLGQRMQLLGLLCLTSNTRSTASLCHLHYTHGNFNTATSCIAAHSLMRTVGVTPVYG
jgi:hypothetical protein